MKTQKATGGPKDDGKERIIKYYERRMGIEASFRDFKNSIGLETLATYKESRKVEPIPSYIDPCDDCSTCDDRAKKWVIEQMQSFIATCLETKEIRVIGAVGDMVGTSSFRPPNFFTFQDSRMFMELDETWVQPGAGRYCQKLCLSA